MSQISADRYADVEGARAEPPAVPRTLRRRSRPQPAQEAPKDSGSPAESRAAATPEPEKAPRPSRPKRPQGTRTKKSAQAAAKEIVPTAVHLPHYLVDKVVAHREATRIPNGGVVVQAVQKARGRLLDLVGAEPVLEAGDFDPITPLPYRPEARLAPLNIRLTRRNLELLDKIAEEHGISRSRLATVALEAFFAE